MIKLNSDVSNEITKFSTERNNKLTKIDTLGEILKNRF